MITITHPTTRQQYTAAAVLEVPYREACQLLARDHGVKRLSLKMLEQAPEGEGFGRRVFEQALDYGIGSAVLGYILALKGSEEKRRPKVVRVAVDRKGNCFVISPNNFIRYAPSLLEQ